jgi:hypothetical protein
MVTRLICLKKCSLIVIVLIFYSTSFGQTKQTDYLRQVWFGYFNQTRLSNHWGLWSDLHLRTKEDFVNDFSQGILRLGLTYYIRNTTKLTAGYAYVHHFPAEGHKEIAQPEHRPWQQVQWHTGYGKKKMMQWFRLEERYRHKILDDSTSGNGYNFNFRLRYNFFFDIPLSSGGLQPGKFSFVVNEEVHINFGKQIVNNYFDQNRFFLGLKYQVSEQDNLQVGYMNVFQQLPAGNKYRNNDVIRIFYFQNFDLRKQADKIK